MKNQMAHLLKQTLRSAARRHLVTNPGRKACSLSIADISSNGFWTMSVRQGKLQDLDTFRLPSVSMWQNVANISVRRQSSLAMPVEEDDNSSLDDKRTIERHKSLPNDDGISKYWGIARKEIVREDGAVWPWNCFKPTEVHLTDLKIDLSKHHKPESFSDKLAYWTVKSLRLPTDIFFQKRYGCRAMMLETVAAVPGMVGGMLLHLQSLRRFEYSGGWIKALLEEAENERMHLMTFMEVAKPAWYERALVIAVQGIFFNAYFLTYIASPRLAHRIVGYLEEEAIYSYTEYLKEIDKGHLPNIPAPAIAIDYWRLSKDATIRDVVTVIRADEAHHRDVNHFASDIRKHGNELREYPAPIEYH